MKKEPLFAVFMFAALSLAVLTGLALLPHSPYVPLLITTLLVVIFLIMIVLVIPFRKKIINEDITLLSRYDERFTMFSRVELTQKPEESALFYHEHPELKELDQVWQSKAGLISRDSLFYHPFSFNAAEASFFTVEMLRPYVNEKANPEISIVEPENLSRFIESWAKKIGAVSVGICETQAYHYYSTRGRGKEYGKKVDLKHKYAIAFTVEMDKVFLATGPAGPTLMESARQYLNAGTIAIQIARFLQNLGYDSRAHIDGNYEVICPLVARDAGLGELGRMGLLMTPELGPRVRIAVVTTDAPLKIDVYKKDPTVDQFCTICRKCADVCPANAIPKTEKKLVNGLLRWQIDQVKCFSYWCTVGTDCGRCMRCLSVFTPE